MGRNVNTSRDEWIAAAIRWIADHGVATLAVEPLARSLGVSKGGFYWCFASRDELLAAALDRWETLVGGKQLSRSNEALNDDHSLRELLVRVAQKIKSNDEHMVLMVRVEHALNCAVHDPRVASTIQRVNSTRLLYMEQLLRREGLDAKAARQRAGLGHAMFIGLIQLRATGQAEPLAGMKGAEFVEAYSHMLLAPVAGVSSVARLAPAAHEESAVLGAPARKATAGAPLTARKRPTRKAAAPRLTRGR